MSKIYAFTAKVNRTDPNISAIDYEDFLFRMIDNECKVIHKHFENDSKGKLHVHGSVEIPSSVYRKSLCPKGMHVLFREEYDSCNWELYCKKDQSSDEMDTDDSDIIKRLNKKLF